MDNKPDVSIVVPVYNGASTLLDLFRRTSIALETIHLLFEVLLVDDGSKDDTWQVILEMKKSYGDKIRGFKLARNSGQHAATLCGLQNANGHWVITMDDDLQNPPEEILKLLQIVKQQQADIVYGIYPSLQHNPFYNVATRLFRYIFHHVAPHYPHGSSFRLIRAEILLMLPKELGPWIFVDPILSWLTDNIVTVKVKHEKKHNRHSRYSIFKLFGLAITLLIVYSTLPLRLMIWVGLLASFISFVTGVYFLFIKLTLGATVGFSALIVTITFASSVILLCLGVLGEYIARIYTMASRRPAFIIQRTI